MGGPALPPPSVQFDGLAQFGLAELIEAAQQHLAQSAPSSLRSLQKCKAVDAPYSHTLPPFYSLDDGTHHRSQPGSSLPSLDGPSSSSSSSSSHPIDSSISTNAADAFLQQAWPDWFCCDVEHTAAPSCADCDAPRCHPAPENGGSCHQGSCTAPSQGTAAVACCVASPCDAPNTEICDGIRSSATACFDTTCTGSPPCTLPIISCCDEPDCSDDKRSPCSVGAAECCDEVHCADPHVGSSLTQSANCPGCKLPVSKTESDGRGRIYSSFQELLDCCCCRSAFPEASIDFDAKTAAHGATPDDATPAYQAPCDDTRRGHPHHLEASTAAALDHTKHGGVHIHEHRVAPRTATPSPSTLVSSQRTPASFEISAYSPSLSTSTVATPYGAGQSYTRPPSAIFGDKHEATSHHSRSSSLVVPQHRYTSIEPQHSTTPEPRQNLGAYSGLSTNDDCQCTQPHSHDPSGGCLPPSWTVCDTASCDTVGPHSHWNAQLYPHSLSTATDQHQLHPRTPHASAERDARPQRCQWAGCSERFWAVEELVAHVNHFHLAKKPTSSIQAPSAPAASTLDSSWQYSRNVAPYSVSNDANGTMSAFSSSSMATPIPCMWNDCHSVSVPEKDVQLDEVVAMLRDAGMRWPSDADAINDKASAVMLQHLLTAHLGQPTQPLHGHTGDDDLASPASAVDSKGIPGVRQGSKRGRSSSGLAEESRPTPRAMKKACRPASEEGAAHDESGEDCCCDNVRVGADGTTGHVCGWERCSETFPDHQSLTEHMTSLHVGSGKAVYECRWVGCERFHEGRQFTQKQKVLRHIQTHTGDRPHKCDVCGRRFSEPNTLAQHKRTHTQEKPYVCDFPGCGKAFSVSGSLTIHKRIHSGAKPFLCKFPGCGKAFAESSNLTKHMRIHTGEKPFQCVECRKRFSRPDQVSRHRKTHERKRNKPKAAAGGAEEGAAGQDEAVDTNDEKERTERTKRSSSNVEDPS